MSAGASWPQAWADAAGVAHEAALATAELRPRVGRARPLAEKSVGTPDAGAVSPSMRVAVVAALAANLTTAANGA